MPSFDVVSEIDMHEVSNAVDQANREVGTRFDFKGCDVKFILKDDVITQHAESDFQIQQMRAILFNKLTKRGVDISSLKTEAVQSTLKQASQIITLRQGIDNDMARKIIKLIKESKSKVQTAIQGEKVRISGKKRDDLQQVISLLREADLDIALQYENFRD